MIKSNSSCEFLFFDLGGDLCKSGPMKAFRIGNKVLPQTLPIKLSLIVSK